MRKNSKKIWATSVFFKKLPKINNRPTGKKSPNLATLVKTYVSPYTLAEIRTHDFLFIRRM
jgi:hypothetical protein